MHLVNSPHFVIGRSVCHTMTKFPFIMKELKRHHFNYHFEFQSIQKIYYVFRYLELLIFLKNALNSPE